MPSVRAGDAVGAEVLEPTAAGALAGALPRMNKVRS